MDKFLRFFIKFHGYCIAVASSILTALFTSIFTSNWAYIRYEEFYNLRYTGIPALVFGLVWMVANSLLFIGIFKEKKKLLYPFLGLFLIDLVLVLLRDFYLLIYDASWYKTVFFSLGLPLMLFIVPYVILSMLALIKLFEVDPIVRTDDNFVRFDRRSNSIDTVTITN